MRAKFQRLKGGIIVALVVAMVMFTSDRLYASDSCWGKYERALWMADAQMRGCISMIHFDTITDKVLFQSQADLCAAEWFSNIFQAETEYGVCMSLAKLVSWFY